MTNPQPMIAVPRATRRKPSLCHIGLRRLVLEGCRATNVPTLLKWAQAGYANALKSNGSVDPYLQIFAKGFGLGNQFAESLLRGEIPVDVVDDTTVHVLLTEKHAALYQACAHDATPLGSATLLSAPA